MAALTQAEAKALELLAAAEGKTLSDLTDYHSLKATPINAVRAVIGPDLLAALDAGGTRVNTIWVRSEDSHPWEAISFPAMVLKEFSQESWDNSALRKHLERILFVGVESEERDASGARILGASFVWSPSETQERAIRQEWLRLQQAVREGKAAYHAANDDQGHQRRTSAGKEIRENDLPRDTDYIHIRPKAQDKDDVDEDPKGNLLTKQAFWLNKEFLQELITSGGNSQEPAPGKPPVPVPQASQGEKAALPHGNLASILRAMRRESKTSVITSGELPALNRALYIPDWVDDAVETFLASKQDRLLVLTGSAGHGKSAAIAVAKQAAARLGVQPDIRPDASHADAPDEDYRAGLRRFLDKWNSGDARKYILGVNLGKALDFFSNRADSQKYTELAEAFDQEFQLGITTSPRPHPGLVIVDISHRIQPKLTNHGLDLPWLRRFLQRLDPNSDQSVIKEAFTHQGRFGLGKHDPLIANIRMLADERVREHLLQALVGTIVRHDVHLTPRRVMDFLSRIVLPSVLDKFLDAEGEWTTEGRAALADGERWGLRLDASLFQQLFPESPDSASFDSGLAMALRRENPTYARSHYMDQRILRWAADPSSLSKDIPIWFLEYLGWKGERVGDGGRRLLIQVAAWTADAAPIPSRTRRVEQFLRICEGDPEARRAALEPLKAGLRHYVTRSFYRQWEEDARPRSIAVQVYRFSFNSRLTTQLDEFHVAISEGARSRWLASEFHIEIHRGSSASMTLNIDWATFDLLMDVAGGYNPASAESGSTVTLNRLQRALQSASSLSHFLEWRDESKPGRLSMYREGTAQKTKVRAELHE